MVGSRTDATRGFPSTRGIEIAPDLIRRLSCQTSNFAIIPSAAGREIQADKSKNSGLTVDRPSKPSTKPSSDRNNTKPNQPNPKLNRTLRRWAGSAPLTSNVKQKHMRKRDHRSVFTDYKSDLATLVKFYDKATFGLNAQKVAPAMHASLAELVFHRGYVAFETYISSIFVAYINQDSAAFQVAHEIGAQKLVSSKLGTWWGTRIKLKKEPHILQSEVESLIDPKGYNLTFSSSKEMIDKSKEWLSATHQAGFIALVSDDYLLIDAAREIRNYIAHQSQSAFDRMNLALKALPATGPISDLKRAQRDVEDIGAYLRSKIAGSDKSRVTFILEQLQQIGKTIKKA